MDVFLVSCLELPEPDPDEAPLKAAFERAGFSCGVKAWDDPNVDWSETSLAFLRATWNYHTQLEAFRGWLARADAATRLLNPLSLVEWNLHKGYLVELASKQIPVVPTEVIAKGSSADLSQLVEARGWSDVVIKPAVSGGSYRTLRANSSNWQDGMAHFEGLVQDRDTLVQVYLPSVEGYGERSLIWIDGQLTHAVRKSPRFLDDDEHVSDAMEISAAERQLAQTCLDSIQTKPFYARIDVAPDENGDPMLMELELIEPSLFFEKQPTSLDAFVSGARRLMS